MPPVPARSPGRPACSLKQWHRDNSHNPSRISANFALLGVSVMLPAEHGKSPEPIVSPRFLSPLRRKRTKSRLSMSAKAPRDATPPRSILKRQAARAPPKTATPGSRRLMFSPYNMVKLIPHRADAKYPPRWSPPRALMFDDVDDDIEFGEEYGGGGAQAGTCFE